MVHYIISIKLVYNLLMKRVIVETSSTQMTLVIGKSRKIIG